MLSEGRFGAAVSFSVRAGDKRQLRVITDAILNVYIVEGKSCTKDRRDMANLFRQVKRHMKRLSKAYPFHS